VVRSRSRHRLSCLLCSWPGTLWHTGAAALAAVSCSCADHPARCYSSGCRAWRVKVGPSPVLRERRTSRVMRALFVDEGTSTQGICASSGRQWMCSRSTSGREEERDGNTTAYQAELFKKRGASQCSNREIKAITSFPSPRTNTGM
jgi:hypothetical protein